ncbi:MAG: DUF131 domain-containing protein [Candidatus Nezhaarchaeales archaeon]
MGRVNLLFTFGLALVFIGVALAFIAVLLLALRGSGKVSGGGVILLGPFPIVFGSDVKALKAVIALTLILMALAVLFTLEVFRW